MMSDEFHYTSRASRGHSILRWVCVGIAVLAAIFILGGGIRSHAQEGLSPTTPIGQIGTVAAGDPACWAGPGALEACGEGSGVDDLDDRLTDVEDQLADDTWRVLAVDGTAHSHTGDTNTAVLATVTVPANTLGPNGAVRVTSVWSAGANNANAKTARVKFCGTTHTAMSAASTVNLRVETGWQNRNNAASQLGYATSSQSGFGPNAGSLVTSSCDTTAAQDITFEAQLGSGTDSLTLQGYIIEVLHRP